MKCTHCKLDFKQEQMIKDEEKYFCCKGCQSVWHIIHELGFEDFYQRLSDQSLKPVNLESEFKDYSHFVKKNKEGFSEIYLMIHDIHCQACVWLNEKILIKEQGILELDISSFTHKARIVFDENFISLKKILELIASIGYKASAYDPLKQEQRASMLKREFYAKLVVAIACVMNIMWISVAKYAGFFSGMDEGIKDILNFAEFILASPVLFYTGGEFYKNAYYSLKNRQISMDFLVIFGSSLAYLYSLWAMFSRIGDVYFDSVAMIICFVFIGRYLELLSRKKASDTLDGLNDFLKGELMVFNGKDFVPKSPYEVKINDIIELKSTDRVLIDGIVCKGGASLDMSSLSGENEPLWVEKGMSISSGSLVLDGRLEYRASKLYEDSKLCQIIALLELASTKKARIESLVSKISIYFSRVVLSLAVLCFFFWFLVQKIGFELSLVHGISLLIISCPCALALATPVSNLVALARALKLKVLFKNASVIEDLSKCNGAVFDKTGVLTKARLELSNYTLSKDLDEGELLAFVNLSKHPISKSVVEFLRSKGVQAKELDFKNTQNIQAKGFKANFNGDLFLGGSEAFLKENHIIIQKPSQNSHFIFAKNGVILASFEFESVLREGAKELINYLKAQKIPIFMLTGDNEKAASKVAKVLDIKNYKASCLPETKMQIVQELSQKYKLLMLGDGVNDALALKSVAVGISLKEGSDLAIESSEVLLLKNDLFTLLSTLKLCKNTLKIIKQNLVFSLCYNAFTIPLAFLGLINPLFAALSMSFSSIVVVLNALRIKE